MCGIAGFAGWEQPDAEATLRAMCDAIVHRGPDEEGIGVYDGVALGMRRLSIIDLAGGSQPVLNEDDTVRVVFNGEIYNFEELRPELERAGHRFRSRSDTEVLVHLYEERGTAMVDVLRGMFGFAIWDGNRRQLLLVRDRLGKKPLYWCVAGHGVAFASELKSLVAAGLAGGAPDPAAIAQYFALGYVPEPATAYPHIRKLPPGHLLTWAPGRAPEVRRYWAPPALADDTIDAQTAIEETRRLLQESVRYRLVSDVPVGAFLSGGIDSAAVVAEMMRQSGQRVKTYTIGFTDPSFDESGAAAVTAQALGTEHTQLIVTPNVDELFETVACAFDEPFADSSAIPTLLVSELAARDVKVVLSGDGGDELFGGYTRYRDFMRRDVDLPGAVRGVLGTIGRSMPYAAYGRNRVLELSADPIGRYTRMVANPLPVRDGGVARTELSEAVRWDHLLSGAFDEARSRDRIGMLMHVDLLTYLPGDILTKVDRMTMARSLEARAPLLDHHLVEFAMRIPTRLKLNADVGKVVFRDAVRELLPASVFARKKSGFGIPLNRWLRCELTHRLDRLTSERNGISEYVDRSAVARLTAEHRSGRRDHTPMLWKLIVLDIWLERVYGRAEVASSAAGLVSA